MFRHRGERRTFLHNLRLASILSLIAGIVNITGLLAVSTLTTNVTGHFAYFTDNLLQHNYAVAVEFLFFILSFLAGAFLSNFLIEIFSRKRPAIAHLFPMMLEILILTLVGTFGERSLLSDVHGELIDCSLLFAMGLQNSLVTKVSQSVVRTTHLTGLFTDLGIELSQIFFYRKAAEIKKLSRSIYLKLAIIGFFFFGCLGGGYIFKMIEMKTLFIASGLLVVALLYDNVRIRFHMLRRKMQSM